MDIHQPSCHPAVGPRGPSRPLLVAQWLFAGVALAYLSALVLTPRVHLLDLPYWVYEGAALRAKVLGTATGAAAEFPLKAYPVPNSLAQVLLAVVVGPLGPAGAGRVVAVLVLSVSLAAFYRLCTLLHGADGVYRTLIFTVTLAASAAYWNGYLNFQLGLAGLALYGAARAKRGEAGPPVSLTLVASLGLFFSHFIPFLAFALGSGLEALRRRDARTLLALVPATGLTAWYVLAKGSADATVAGGYPDAFSFVLYKAYTILKLGPFVNFVNADGAGVLDAVPWLFLVLMGGAAFFVVALGVALLSGSRALLQTSEVRSRTRLQVVVLGLGLAALGLALPPIWLSVVNPGERFMAVAVLLLVAVVPMPKRMLCVLAYAALPFVAYDVTVLATQPMPDPAWVEADLHRREALGTARFEGQFDDHLARQQEGGGTRFPWLVRNRFDHAAYYLALERGRWTLPLPSTGLIEGTDP